MRRNGRKPASCLNDHVEIVLPPVSKPDHAKCARSHHRRKNAESWPKSVEYMARMPFMNIITLRSTRGYQQTNPVPIHHVHIKVSKTISTKLRANMPRFNNASSSHSNPFILYIYPLPLSLPQLKLISPSLKLPMIPPIHLRRFIICRHLDRRLMRMRILIRRRWLMHLRHSRRRRVRRMRSVNRVFGLVAWLVAVALVGRAGGGVRVRFTGVLPSAPEEEGD